MENGLPVILNISKKSCLVIGAGKVAYRKIKMLLNYETNIKVISEEIIEKKIETLKNIKIIKRKIEDKDIERNYFLVIAATNDAITNKRIFDICIEKNILINSVDDVPNSTFIFPALVERGKLKVAITTIGSSPLIAKKIKNKINKNLPEKLEKYFEIIYNYRVKAKQEIKQYNLRLKFYKKCEELLDIDNLIDIDSFNNKIDSSFCEISKMGVNINNN